MPYINLPPVVSEMFWDLDRRIRSLETAYRFNVPNVNFNTNAPTNSNTGDMFYDTYADILKYWDGTNWVEIADNSLGTSLLSWTPTWSGTGLAYTGTPASGRYMKIGKLIHFQITVVCTTVTNFGTGGYSITLPTGLAPNYRFLVNGAIRKGSADWNIEGFLTAGSTTITLGHPTANGGTDIFSHNKPTTLTTADVWYISGQYFIA